MQQIQPANTTIYLSKKTCANSRIRALNRFKERKRKPETNEILTGTEPEPETKSNFIVPNRIKKIEMAINRLITLFYRSI